MIKVRTGIAGLAFCGLLGACSDGGTAKPADGGGGNTVQPNPFEPSDLKMAAAALSAAIADAANAADIKVAVVANRHSNYWTPAQIGAGRAASSIGCFSSFDATSDGLSASQVDILNRKVTESFAGISVSAIDATGIEPAIANAVSKGVNVITFDSDAAPGSQRTLYLGTVNYEAGKAAGAKMAELLGTAGGKVVAVAGLSTAANAQERIQGIRDAFNGTNVTMVKSYFDDINFDTARTNVESALTETPDLAGIIGVYAYNGPIALGVLEAQHKVGAVKLVAFDLDTATLDGLAAGKVDAAIGQRPYWMGYLSVYLLYSMKALGVAQTKTLLAPWMSGTNGDIFSTGQDIVTPATIGKYREYLESLGISSS